MREKPKILYVKYKEKQREQEEAAKIREDLKEKLPSEETAIVVKKESLVIGAARVGVELLGTTVKGLFFVAILVLASIGATVLINETTRTAFFMLF